MLALLNHIKRHEMTSSSCEFGWKIDNKHTSNSTGGLDRSTPLALFGV